MTEGAGDPTIYNRPSMLGGNTYRLIPGEDYRVGLIGEEPVSGTENPSGIYPTEFKVLIDPKPIEEKIGSVYLPAETVDREKYGQIKGRIVAVSPHAFTYADREAWIEAGVPKPKAGDIALYARHSGLRVKGKDGKDYLLVNDKDICATIED